MLWQYNWWTALYHMDGNANDSWTAAENGTSTNITWVEWKIGTLAASSPANWSITTSNTDIWCWKSTMTFALWINPPSLQSGTYYTTALQKWQSWSNPTTFFFQCANDAYIPSSEQGKYYFLVNDGTTRKITSNALFTDDTWTWHRLVITYNSWTVSIYRDWALDKSESIWWTTLPSSTRWLDIGWGSFDNSWFQWLIDEVVIEERVWSLAEIKKDYTCWKWRFWIL